MRINFSDTFRCVSSTIADIVAVKKPTTSIPKISNKKTL